jgi:precorrin-6y C5,15-methyltransferase (decarboxylating) CbiE subunit
MRTDPLARDNAASPRWLSIVGIGEDGVDGLSPVARGLIAAAEIVFGGERHLALAAPLIRGATRPWPSPFERGIEEVLARRGRAVCVLASGDPFLHGVGSVLARHVDPGETVVAPAPSTFSLAAARLGWALPEAAMVSLHGKALDLVRPHLHPGARVLALTSDGDGPAALAQLLTETGFGGSRLTVLEALGGQRERVRGTPARTRGCWRARPAFPTRCSSTTGRSPSARCVRLLCRRWRRAAANCCGMSAPARVRWRSNGCWPTRRSARWRSRRTPRAPPASAATPPPSAYRGWT